jgi:hypothetical protein
MKQPHPARENARMANNNNIPLVLAFIIAYLPKIELVGALIPYDNLM